jgi:hypothetical protein
LPAVATTGIQIRQLSFYYENAALSGLTAFSWFGVSGISGSWLFDSVTILPAFILTENRILTQIGFLADNPGGYLPEMIRL